jgi:hypothetical protein
VTAFAIYRSAEAILQGALYIKSSIFTPRKRTFSPRFRRKPRTFTYLLLPDSARLFAQKL